tara:strand:- start:485 stop:754 length:270 start_codon:yes stop_codon:yes gene_type:complete
MTTEPVVRGDLTGVPYQQHQEISLGRPVIILPLTPLDTGGEYYIWKMVNAVDLKGNNESGIQYQNDGWYVRDYCKNTTHIVWMCKKRTE